MLMSLNDEINDWLTNWLVHIGWYCGSNERQRSWRIEVCEHGHDNVLGYWRDSWSKMV